MKEKILLCAREVFNQKGIQHSTLRDIAKELSISDGHLRYYFKTKEDLVLATFTEMEQTIASFAGEEDTTLAGAQAIVGAITNSFAVMYRYAYFFTESPVLLEQYPKVHSAYQQLIANRKDLFLHTFEEFKTAGVFIPDVDTALFPVLFEQFFIFSDNWVKYARLPNQQNLNETEKTNHYVAVAMALFLPYFNPQLREEVLTWIKQVY